MRTKPRAPLFPKPGLFIARFVAAAAVRIAPVLHQTVLKSQSNQGEKMYFVTLLLFLLACFLFYALFDQ
jgi:hypothetical protein